MVISTFIKMYKDATEDVNKFGKLVVKATILLIVCASFAIIWGLVNEGVSYMPRLF